VCSHRDPGSLRNSRDELIVYLEAGWIEPLHTIGQLLQDLGQFLEPLLPPLLEVGLEDFVEEDLERATRVWDGRDGRIDCSAHPIASFLRRQGLDAFVWHALIFSLTPEYVTAPRLMGSGDQRRIEPG